uniref:Uncharacterized protein n=1 Tax=Rhizophora mucronata TaxID=61149 RepID=A0A2P2KSP2_RHIMU
MRPAKIDKQAFFFLLLSHVLYNMWV